MDVPDMAEITLHGGDAGDSEIHARGPQMLVGYLHPEDEAGSFDDEGYFRTGDLARWVDHDYLVVTGRAKDVIIRNGENISPKEIEDILIGHPGIAEIAVVGLPDDPNRGARLCCHRAFAASRSPTSPACVASCGITASRNSKPRSKWSSGSNYQERRREGAQAPDPGGPDGRRMDEMQVAIVTGASGGIGFGCATKLAGIGMAVLATGRNEQRLDELAAAVDDPDRIATLAVDLTDDAAPAHIVEIAVERWGQVDFLINNAGVGNPKPLHETDDETLDYFLDLMLRAPFRLARDVLPHMRPGSAIINVTSTFAVVGGLRGGPYAAAKGGLTALTTHIACQYGPQGIRCNAVAPGVTLTPMTATRLQDQRFRRSTSR